MKACNRIPPNYGLISIILASVLLWLWALVILM